MCEHQGQIISDHTFYKFISFQITTSQARFHVAQSLCVGAVALSQVTSTQVVQALVSLVVTVSAAAMVVEF